jgi:rhodanese-related sulfurtransferase
MNLEKDREPTNSFQKFIAERKYLIPVAIFIFMIIAGTGMTSIIAYQHQMSLLVYLQSFSTPQISVGELASGKLKSIVLIDVRSPEEYQEDHIGNSELVPLSEIENVMGIQQVRTIVKNYEKTHQTKPTIILYCTSGMRSIKANKELSNNGYQALTLTGGITEWRKQVVRSQDLQVLSAK